MTDLLEELAATGYPVDSIAELRDSGMQYRAAIPVLLKWLSRAGSSLEKEQIIRALSVPWARVEALDPLIKEFRALPAPGDPQQELLRWAVGNGIEILWDDSRFDELVELARDERFGKAREMIVLGLGRSKNSKAGEALIEMLDDPVINGHAVKALGKMKIPEPRARQALERMLNDNRAWVRKDAQRALSKIP